MGGAGGHEGDGEGCRGRGRQGWGPVSRREVGSGPATPPTSDPDRSLTARPSARPRASPPGPAGDAARLLHGAPRHGSARDLLLGGGQQGLPSPSLVPCSSAFISCRITWDVAERSGVSAGEWSTAEQRCPGAGVPDEEKQQWHADSRAVQGLAEDFCLFAGNGKYAQLHPLPPAHVERWW